MKNNTMINTNINNNIPFVPIVFYSNADTFIKDILKENSEKLVFTDKLI